MKESLMKFRDFVATKEEEKKEPEEKEEDE